MTKEHFHYLGSLHDPFERDGKFYALLDVITTNSSGPSIPYGERWRPSYESLKRYLGTFLNAPLIGPPCLEDCMGDACRLCGHKSVKRMGSPVKFTMPDGYGQVLYEITDPEAVENVKLGKWRDVSPLVSAGRFHKEADVTVLDEWEAEHVAFVNKGAFENVQVVDWWQGDTDQWYHLAADLRNEHPPTRDLKDIERDIEISNDMNQMRQLREALDAQNLENETRGRLHNVHKEPEMTWQELADYARQLRLSIPSVEQIRERIESEEGEKAVRQKLHHPRRHR